MTSRISRRMVVVILAPVNFGVWSGRIATSGLFSFARAQSTVLGTASQMQVGRPATTFGFAHFIRKRV